MSLTDHEPTSYPVILRGSQKETSEQLIAIAGDGKTIITIALYADQEPVREKPARARRTYTRKAKQKPNGADIDKAEAGAGAE